MCGSFRLAALIFILASSFAQGSYAQNSNTKNSRAAAPSESATYCARPPRVGMWDYRDRSDPQVRWNIEDNRQNHLDPAKGRMQQGELSQRVIGDIVWTLDRYPNHHVALDLLIKYALAGGALFEFSPFECYFQWAREFAPDDTNVRLAEAYFYWRTKRPKNAVEYYEEALKIDPQSASAHYNLGLLQFELQNFDAAAKHAAIAYSFGHPLPGLKTKLQQKGIALPEVAAVASE